MSEIAMEYQSFDGEPGGADGTGGRPLDDDAAGLSRLHDVPVEVAVEIGRTRMTIRQALALGPGAFVTLDRLAGEPVDLLVNGQAIARGEVVVIDEDFGLRITEIIGAAPTAAVPTEPPPVL